MILVLNMMKQIKSSLGVEWSIASLNLSRILFGWMSASLTLGSMHGNQ